MPETRDIGRFYAHTMRYPETNGWPPLVEAANTQEVEEPYRKGRGVVLRLWGRKAVVLGRWKKPVGVDTDDALMAALEGEVLPVTADEIADW